jgi:hypothetical protein
MPMWLRSLIFYPMLWLRGISGLILMILGGLFLLGGIFTLIGIGLRFQTIMFFGFSFACFMIRQTYDQILLKLNPTGHELTLFQ